MKVPGTERPSGLGFASHRRNGYTVAELSGELDIVCAPTLREQLLGVLRPDASRLVVDLSQVNFCDASGLTVLIGTGRRAELLGGVLRLAAPSPSATRILRSLGFHRKLDIFSTVLAATTSRESLPSGLDPVEARHTRSMKRQGATPDAEELRRAVAALLAEIDAWHEADPEGRFTPTLHVLARAYARVDHLALTKAARSLVSALAHHPLTPSPAVAAAANRLRRIIEGDSRR